jgi:transcriptional regulator GlxA family with amidase domain
MSHIPVVASFVIVMALLAGCVPLAAPATVAPTEVAKKPVLLVVQVGPHPLELMLTQEVDVMISTLEGAGYDVMVASPSGELIVGGAATLQPDMELADVKIDDYGGVIVPDFGANMEPYEPPPEAVEVVKSAASKGIPLAAQSSAVEMLDDAGILDGKQFAYPEMFVRGIHSGAHAGEGVVQDGKIITSAISPGWMKMLSRQDGTLELTQKLIAAMD